MEPHGSSPSCQSKSMTTEVAAEAGVQSGECPHARMVSNYIRSEEVMRKVLLSINGTVQPKKAMIQLGRCMVCGRHAGQDNLNQLGLEWETTPISIILYCENPECEAVAERSRIYDCVTPYLRKYIPLSWLFNGCNNTDPNHYKHKSPSSYDMDPSDKMSVLVREELLIPRTKGPNTLAMVNSLANLVLWISRSDGKLLINMMWPQDDEMMHKDIKFIDLLELNPKSSILKEMVAGLLNKSNLPQPLIEILEENGVFVELLGVSMS